jgi:hypothetical protein
MPPPADEKAAAYKKLGKILRDPEQRKRFKNDPDGTLGNEKKAIDEGVLTTLQSLTVDELGVLARVNDSLDAAGVSAVNKAEMV